MTDLPQVSSTEVRVILELARGRLTTPGDYVELGCYRGDTSIELQRLLCVEAARSGDGIEVGVARSGVGAGVAGGGVEVGNDVEGGGDIGAGGGIEVGGSIEAGAVRPFHHLWIYDSFAGLPPKSPQDTSVVGDAFVEGALAVTKREVVERFKKAGLPLPRIKKAFFEDLAPADLPERIAFAFLDGDLYQSIRVSLELVFPRLHRDGVMVVHDYNNPGLPGVARAVDEFLARHRCGLEKRCSLAIITKLA